MRTALNNCTIAADNLGTLAVYGDVLNSLLSAALNVTKLTVYDGDLTDTTIQGGGTLGIIDVSGVISDPTPGDDEIHAGAGSFTITDSTKSVLVDALNPATFGPGGQQITASVA